MVQVLLLFLSVVFIASCDISTNDSLKEEANALNESIVYIENLRSLEASQEKLNAYFYWSSEFTNKIEIYSDQDLTKLNSVVYLDTKEELKFEESLWDFTIVSQTEKAFKVFGARAISFDKSVYVWLKKEDVGIGIMADEYSGREVPLYAEKDTSSNIVVVIKKGIIARIMGYDLPWVQVQFSENAQDVGWLLEHQVCGNVFAPCEYVEPRENK